MSASDIGLIGLAVMGQNLVLNMERNGYQVSVYNRTEERTKEFMDGSASGKNIIPAYSIEEFIETLSQPRRIMIMVKSGAPVDAVIEQLKPYLDPGDLLIDGGNSYFKDTEHRTQALEALGFSYLGVGISGGEEGALWGPSIMPGGQSQAYTHVEPIYTDIAAKVDGDPCVTYIGPRGAGHYVKMVHNGIEYGDMQLIAEAYDLLHHGLGLSSTELHGVFTTWNEDILASFLIEITADIFAYLDEESGVPLVELILDKAQQKGTGKWTSQEALVLGVPTPTINAAVEARILSAYKTERGKAALLYPGKKKRYRGDHETFIAAVKDALYASKISAYAQGMALLSAASREYEYDLKLAEVARIWRGGCIIRARLLEDIRTAYVEDPDLPNLLLAPFFREALLSRQESWRHVLQTAVDLEIPTPAMGASLAIFDGYRRAMLPANLIQAQRDYFGAHTYQRVDREGTFHTEWTN
jgi:6-phosphogluconate dehydrogenase